MNLPIFSQAGHFKGKRRVPMHSHPGMELIYVSSGSGSIAVAGEMWKVSQGDLLVIAPEAEHDQHSQPMLETFFAVFLADAALLRQETRLIHTDADTWIVRWMRELEELAVRREHMLCAGLLIPLLQRLSALEQRDDAGNGHPGLRKSLEYILGHFCDPGFSLDAAAERAGISRSYLKTLFYREFALSPGIYVRDLRMARAREYLCGQEFFIEEIAGKCGYADSNYFARIFRRIHRCSPSQYREFQKTRPEKSTIRH